jgi:fibronectin type 3 domain-containing protein
VTHAAGVTLVVNAVSTTAVPGQPAAPTVAPANGKGVNVSWSAPASNGGSPVTGYRIYRGAGSGTMTPLTTLGNVTSYKDTSTSRGATYYYAVSAINTVGEGPPSAPGGPVVAR